MKLYYPPTKREVSEGRRELRLREQIHSKKNLNFSRLLFVKMVDFREVSIIPTSMEFIGKTIVVVCTPIPFQEVRELKMQREVLVGKKLLQNRVVII